MNENRNGAAATAPPAAMDPSLDGRHQDPRSIGDLIRELADEGRSLLRSEVSLVKAELTEKVHVYERNTSKIAIGGALLMAALLFALWAVNMGVTALLLMVVQEEVAVWLAPLIIAVILGIVGRSMVSGGTKEIRHEGIVPERTATTLRDDARWAKDQVKHG